MPLSGEQIEYLHRRAGIAALAKHAFGLIALLPVAIGVAGFALSRVAARIPFIGWVLALYGVVFTIVCVLAGVAAIPLLALVVAPLVILRERPRIRRDIASGCALRESGSFPVNEKRRGATLVCAGQKFDLSKDQLEALRPALAAGDGGQALAGTVVRTLHRPLLLKIEGLSGETLVDVTG